MSDKSGNGARKPLFPDDPLEAEGSSSAWPLPKPGDEVAYLGPNNEGEGGRFMVKRLATQAGKRVLHLDDGTGKGAIIPLSWVVGIMRRASSPVTT
jgi:hypothetical protein